MKQFVKEILVCAERTVKKGQLSSDVTQTDIISTAVAISVGYNLPLPTAAVTDHKEYFTTMVEDTAESIVSQINEYTPLPFNRVMKLVQSVWTTRYKVLHVPLSQAAYEAITHSLCHESNDLSPIQKEAVGAVFGNEGSYLLQLMNSSFKNEFEILNSREHVESE